MKRPVGESRGTRLAMRPPNDQAVEHLPVERGPHFNGESFVAPRSSEVRFGCSSREVNGGLFLQDSPEELVERKSPVHPSEPMPSLDDEQLVVSCSESGPGPSGPWGPMYSETLGTGTGLYWDWSGLGLVCTGTGLYWDSGAKTTGRQQMFNLNLNFVALRL